MKLIDQNAWKYLSVKLPILGAFLMLVLIPALQWALDFQVIPQQHHALIVGIIIPALAWIGKKIAQPELHQSTSSAQIQAFASALPTQKKNFVLGSRSLTNLQGVHPDLVKVVKRAIQISECDFTVIEGVRTAARQAQLVKQGASQTKNSRHLTGHAVDLGAWVNGTVTWDWKYYYQIEKAMKQAAKELNIPIEWGGDWKTFKDGPHFQLPWGYK